MIADQNTHPQRQLYYLGARIIEALNSGADTDDIFGLYQTIKEKEDISVNLFNLTLDWLFLLNVIFIEDGAIKKCS